MTHLGFDRFHVVGHDRGGRVGQPVGSRSRRQGSQPHGDGHHSHPAPVRERRPKVRRVVLVLVLLHGTRPGSRDLHQPELRVFHEHRVLRKARHDRAKGHSITSCAPCGGRGRRTRSAKTTAQHRPSISNTTERISTRSSLCPLLVLWGDENPLNKGVDIVGIWKERANDVRGHGTPSAHWLPEQIPEQVIEEVTAFIDENS